MSDPTFDYVIIGAGTAGCLLANRLSADPAAPRVADRSWRRDNYHWIHIPVGYLRCIGNPRTDWRYRTEREPGLNGRDLLYPRGKVLGGSSSINGMIYMRGQARDYDAWAALTGDDAWSWRNVLPDFRAHEGSYRCERVRHVHARRGGEWRVSRQRLRWDILDAFAAAAEQAGIRAHRGFQSRRQRGRQLLRREPARRSARERGQGVSQAGASARQSHGVDAHARRAAAVRARRGWRDCAAPARRCCAAPNASRCAPRAK